MIHNWRWRAAGPRGLWLLLLVVHLAGILYYLPASENFDNPPIARTDYTTHFYQAAAVTHFWREAGHAWGYDPYLLAGYPLGTVFEVNNKGIETGTWLLSSFVHLPLAFNGVVLVLFAVLPLSIYAAGRLAGLSPWARAVAVLLALALWYIDPALRLAWAGGTFAFAAASGLAVFLLAAFVHYLNKPTWCAWAILSAAAPLTVLIGPQVTVALAVPILAAYVSSASRLMPRQHLGLAAVAGLVLAINAFWLWPFLRFIDIKANSDQFLQVGLANLVEDVLGTGRVDGGPPCRCGLRWLVLGLTVWLWLRGKRNQNYVPAFAAGVVTSFGLAYLGSTWQPLADLQPYRFVISAGLMATLPAADAVVRLAANPPRVRWTTIAAGLAAIFLVARAAESAWYFRPHLSRIGQPVLPGDDRLGGPPPSYKMLMDWIVAHTTRDGRLMVNDWRVGTLIPYYTDREVIGGPFLWTWIEHGHANAGIWDAFGHDLNSYTEAELHQAMQTYNVQWVITNADFDDPFYTLDDVARRWPELLQPVEEVAGFRIYRVPWPADNFLVGGGRVSSTYNQLTVREASPDGIVLKYHWLPTLRSYPPLPLRPYPVPGDPVGFIQVDNGATRDFVIYNGY